MPTRLEKNLQHSKAAYLFAINSLPFPKDFPIRVNGMEFSKKSQIDSMEIEFGWSFFCRYEACLESFLKSKNIQLSKKLSLHDWFIKNNVEVPNDYIEGLEIYRTIRNLLHHEDGATPGGDLNTEIHLSPLHMNNFYSLFIWCGEQIEAVATKQINKDKKLRSV